MAIHEPRSPGCSILLIYTVLPFAAAEDGINWAAVGIAWVFSLLTTLVIVGVAAVLLGKRIKKKKKNRPDEDGLSGPSFRRELSVQSEASDMTRVSVQSGQPLYTSGGYKRVPVRESNINRRKSDYISTWCSKHGLSEVIAANLRENGFTSRDQVDSLLPCDVITLGLPNLAQQVQLRNVLDQLRHTEHTSASRPRDEYSDRREERDHGGKPSTGSQNRVHSGSSDRSRPRSSTTDDSTAPTPSPKQMSPASLTLPASGMFPYSKSLGQLTEEKPLQILHTSIAGVRTHNSRLSFHGLLSDSGLYELADCLGTEWRHLAAVLGIGKAQQEHLLNDHPGNTKQQIYEMLRQWREFIARGEKEQVKAQLAESLTKIKRKDLADKILREQVHGSDPNLRGPHRMNSVV